jgi:hypothetical protein
MRGFPFLSGLAAVWLAAVALGDIAPFPRPRPQPRPPEPRPAEPDLPVLERGTQIEMQSAQVSAVLRPSGGDSGRQAVVADVACEFTLHCTEASRPVNRFTMAFPYSAEGDRGPRCTSFSAQVDGARPAFLRDARWSPPESGPRAEYRGYVWPTSITRGGKQTVRVTYALQLPVRNDTADFTYILRTGASWRRPIGEETVRIKADGGLRIAPARARDLKPTRQTGEELVWELKQFVPTEDIHVTVSRNGRS